MNQEACAHLDSVEPGEPELVEAVPPQGAGHTEVVEGARDIPGDRGSIKGSHGWYEAGDHLWGFPFLTKESLV